MITSTVIDQRLLDQLVAKIVEAAHPRRIILFGSAARGQMGPHSDLDLLVVMPDGVHRRRTAQAVYLGLSGLGIAKDVVVVTESDVRDYGDNPSLVLFPALREGREIYRAGTSESLPSGPTASRGGNEGRCTVPDGRPTPGSPREWLARAKGDLALASAPLPPGGFYEDLCFHAQQAAEKAIKAIYVDRGWTFPYVHDLERLLTGLRERGLEPPETVAQAALLTSYAFEARYPGLGAPVADEDYKRALELANAVVRWVESEIERHPA